MIKYFRLIIPIFTVFFIAQAAYAQHNNGTYTSLNAGVSYADNVNQNGRVDNGFGNAGADLYLGDFVSPYFAPEIGVGYWAIGTVGKAGILAFNGRLNAPVSQKVSLFGKLGIGLGELRTCYQSGCNTTDTMVPTIGAGLGVNVTRQWLVTTEFNGAYFPQSTGNGHGVIGGLTLGATRLWNM